MKIIKNLIVFINYYVNSIFTLAKTTLKIKNIVKRLNY
jgi:hypothetical protein